MKELSKWQEKRKEIGVPLTARLLLSVGELSVRKNHKVVIEALQELPSDYWYVIVGKGELGDSLRSIDKTGRLRLLGYRTDIVELLRASDLFVFPSLQEGLPVALMEAMSCGVACIASRIRGNVDLVTNVDHLFEPKNTTEVLNQITLQLQHENKSDDNLYNSLDSKSYNTSGCVLQNLNNLHNTEPNHIQNYSLKNVTTVMLGIYSPPPPRNHKNASQDNHS